MTQGEEKEPWKAIPAVIVAVLQVSFFVASAEMAEMEAKVFPKVHTKENNEQIIK